MASKARVPRAEITGIFGAMTNRFIKKKLGQVPEPLGVMWHNRPVLKAFFSFAGKAGKWNACDPQLKSLAHMAAVSMVGCSFCLDLGYFRDHNIALARQLLTIDLDDCGSSTRVSSI